MDAGGYAQAAKVGYGITSSYKEAQAKKAQLRYQSRVARNNAQLAEWGAQQETIVGRSEEQASRMRTAQIFSGQRAAMAANGVDLGDGSAVDVLASTRFMGERDALTIRDNAARRAWGLRIQKMNFESEAKMLEAGASAVSPFSAMLGSLMGNASSVASMYGGK